MLDANTRHPARARRSLVEAGTLDPTLLGLRALVVRSVRRIRERNG